MGQLAQEMDREGVRRTINDLNSLRNQVINIARNCGEIVHSYHLLLQGSTDEEDVLAFEKSRNEAFAEAKSKMTDLTEEEKQTLREGFEFLLS